MTTEILVTKQQLQNLLERLEERQNDAKNPVHTNLIAIEMTSSGQDEDGLNADSVKFWAVSGKDRQTDSFLGTN